MSTVISDPEGIFYADFAESVYDSIEQSEDSEYTYYSRLGKTSLFSNVGLKSSYTITRYLYRTGTTGAGLFITKSTAWMGYIAKEEDATKKQCNIAVVLRGTLSTEEWWNNLKIDMTPFIFVKGEEAKVHLGFMRLYSKNDSTKPFGTKSLRNQIWDELNSLANKSVYTDVRITLTGHSLGGALVLLAACDMGANLSVPNKKITFNVYTYGSPKPGDQVFKTTVEGYVSMILRYENIGDLVPGLPTGDYVEVGTLKLVDTTHSTYLKPEAWWTNAIHKHNLQIYRHGIFLGDTVDLDVFPSASLYVESLSKMLIQGEEGQDQDQSVTSLKNLKGLFEYCEEEDGSNQVVNDQYLRMFLRQCVYVQKRQKDLKDMLKEDLSKCQEDPNLEYVLVNKWLDALDDSYKVPVSWWANANKDIKQSFLGGPWLPRSYREEDKPLATNDEYN